MKIKEIQDKAFASINRYFKSILGVEIILCVMYIGTFLVIYNFDLDDNITQLLCSLSCILLNGIFCFGKADYFLRLSRNEYTNFKQLFTHTNMIWTYCIISLLVGFLVYFSCLLFIIPGIILAISYSMVYFVKIDNPDLGPIKVLKKSREIMKGNKWKYFCLCLSFCVWFLLILPTVGLVLFVIYPLIQLSCAHFYNSIKDLNVTTSK